MPSYEPSFFTQSLSKSSIPAGMRSHRSRGRPSPPIRKLLPGRRRAASIFRMSPASAAAKKANTRSTSICASAAMPNFAERRRHVCDADFLGEHAIICRMPLLARSAKICWTRRRIPSHTLRMQYAATDFVKVMADNNLDALVYPYTTIPPHIVVGQAARSKCTTRAPSRASSKPARSSPIRIFLPGEAVLEDRSGSFSRRRRQLVR